MNKVARRVSLGFGIFIGLLILAVAGFALFFDANKYKPQIEAGVAKATGMELKINGKASLKILPHIRIALNDVHLTNHGSELFQTEALDVTPKLLPLLHSELQIDHVGLDHPKILVEKFANGKMNYETAARAHEQAGRNARQGGGGGIRSFTIKDGELTYVDQKGGSKIVAKGIETHLSDLIWGPSGASSVTFHGKAQAASVDTGKLKASNLQADLKGDHGVIRLDKTNVDLFGGKLQGSAQVDARTHDPKLELSQTASRIDLAQVPSGAKGRLSGSADGKVDLKAHGATADALTKTATGNVSLRSDDVTVTGVDVDKVAGQLKAAESMNLAQIGTSVFSGAVAPQPGGAAPAQAKTVIKHLVSDWTIADGMARTKDVALSTEKSTVAFKGEINLVNKTYKDFYVASVDRQGCAKDKVEIAGTLMKPHPNVNAMAGRIAERELGAEIGSLFGKKKEPEKPDQPAKPSDAGSCDRFYSGEAIRTG